MVPRPLRLSLALAVLSLCLPLTARGADDVSDEKKAVAAAGRDVVGLLPYLDDADVRGRGEQIGKKHELEYVSYAFKPRTRGGLGVGACGRPVPGLRDGIGIELTIIELARPGKAVPPALLGPNKNDLIHLARTTEAVAEITYAYTPKRGMPGKDPSAWVKSTDDMKQASRDLAAAADAGDARAIKVAAVRLNNACNDCHIVWRD
jgi:hypothetical protein